MDLGLKGKVAVVTGGSSGIGRGTASILAEEGAIVEIVARREDALAEAVLSCSAHGIVAGRTLDVCDHAAYEAYLKDIAAKHGRLDIVINNAGAAEYAFVEEVSLESWHRAFQLNVDAAFVSLRAALPLMYEAGSGAMVNVTSILGVRCFAGYSAYGAAKAALQQLTNMAAMETGPHAVRLNTVQIGTVLTESSRGFFEAMPGLHERLVRVTPLKRIGVVEEAAAAIAFLASDRASFINGACLAVDGGMSVALPN